ncbi:MAG: formate dehydrogenase accessory protein FdhE [Gemmatimonadales bacterium]
MHGTTPGFRADPAARLADLERQRPEWQAWLRLLGEVLCVLDDPAWSAPLADGGLDGATGPGSPGDPLLNARVLVVDARRLRRLVHRLIETASAAGGAGAGSLAGYRPSSDTAVHLLAVALRHDRAGISGVAASAGVDAGVLETVARLAAVPLLHSCGRLLQDEVPLSWPHGYCPICGSWPLLAELRSLGRTRRLRCGRCGGDWRVNWLCCPYCGEKDHERLGALVLDGKPETLTVETCSRCLGYLKSVTTLQAIAPFELLLRDLETVELDVAAIDRGYARPRGDGFPLDLRLAVGSP